MAQADFRLDSDGCARKRKGPPGKSLGGESQGLGPRDRGLEGNDALQGLA